MNTIDDAEIHQIVQRVLKQVLGQSQPAAALSSCLPPPAEAAPTSVTAGPGRRKWSRSARITAASS